MARSSERRTTVVLDEPVGILEHDCRAHPSDVNGAPRFENGTRAGRLAMSLQLDAGAIESKERSGENGC